MTRAPCRFVSLTQVVFFFSMLVGCGDVVDGSAECENAKPKMTFYIDADGDGFGDSRFSMEACSAPLGHVANKADCDDLNRERNPNEVEVCNGEDTDCSGTKDDNEAIGTAKECAAQSCVEIRDANPISADGTFWIDPASDDPFEVYCDQTTEP